MNLMVQHFLIYSDSTSSETVCGSDTIQASDCVGMICTHSLKINPPSSCLSSTAGVSITVTVIATMQYNILFLHQLIQQETFLIVLCLGNNSVMHTLIHAHMYNTFTRKYTYSCTNTCII